MAASAGNTFTRVAIEVLIGLVHLAQSELAVVRVENAIATDLVLQRKGLGFELDAVLAGDLGPHIHGCRRFSSG